MIYWNIKTPKQLFASCIWNISELIKISLGKNAPIVFGWMIGSKNNKLKQYERKRLSIYNQRDSDIP